MEIKTISNGNIIVSKKLAISSSQKLLAEIISFEESSKINRIVAETLPIASSVTEVMDKLETVLLAAETENTNDIL